MFTAMLPGKPIQHLLTCVKVVMMPLCWQMPKSKKALSDCICLTFTGFCGLQGTFQKCVVLAACLRAAVKARVQAKLPALSFEDLSSLLGSLSSVKASSTKKLVEDAAAVIASRCAVEYSAATEPLEAALGNGSLALQAEATELMHLVQALLVFGPCDGFSAEPGTFSASVHPPQWAQTVAQPAVRLVLHAFISEVAHELARVAGVAEAVYASYLEKLF
jgi:hypothetical protein